MSPVVSSDGIISIGLHREGDAQFLCELDADAEHRRRFEISEGVVPSIEHSQQVMVSWAKDRLNGARFTFAVRRVGDDQLVGGCELQPRNSRVANVSYWTHPRYRGSGFATRAVALLSSGEIAICQGLTVLEILADVDNTSSRRVAHNCGYVDVGFRYDKVLHILTVERLAWV